MYGGRRHDRQRGPAEQHHPDDHENTLCHGRGRVSAGGPNSQAPAIRNSMAGDHRFCSGVCAALVEEPGAADLGVYLAALGNHGADRALRLEASAVEARAATFFCGARRTSGIGLRCRRSGSDGNRGPAGRRRRLVRHYWRGQRDADWAGGVLGRSGAVALTDARGASGACACPGTRAFPPARPEAGWWRPSPRPRRHTPSAGRGRSARTAPACRCPCSPRSRA